MNKIANLFIGLILVYSCLVLVRSIYRSILFTNRDRITIVFYGEKAKFVSLGLSDGVNYTGQFDHGAQVHVPGGYGRYKVGSLGRLVDLEKNPSIFQRSFSSILSTQVDFYFYPRSSSIYSFDQDESEGDSGINISFLDMVLNKNYKTNAGFIDRLYIYFSLKSKKKSDFSPLVVTYTLEEEGERIFQEDRFENRYQGYFYQNSIRSERKEVRIYYNNYRSALVLSRVIEGIGIRIVDLSHIENPKSECEIIQSDKMSETAQFLHNIYNCKIKNGNVETADIAIYLGANLESLWE